MFDAAGGAWVALQWCCTDVVILKAICLQVYGWSISLLLWRSRPRKASQRPFEASCRHVEGYPSENTQCICVWLAVWLSYVYKICKKNSTGPFAYVHQWDGRWIVDMKFRHITVKFPNCTVFDQPRPYWGVEERVGTLGNMHQFQAFNLCLSFWCRSKLTAWERLVCYVAVVQIRGTGGFQRIAVA